PDRDPDHQREGEVGVAQPLDTLRRHAESREEMVDRAEVRLHHPAPEETDDDEAGRPGKKEERTGKRAATEAAVEPDREAERDDRGDDDNADGPQDGPQQRIAERRS